MTARPKASSIKGKTSINKGANEFSEKDHKSALASIGCAVCWKVYGPHEPATVELHHLRAGGWGKGNYKTLIPLCVEHHRGKTGVHGLGTKGFVSFYGFSQHDLLDWALLKSGLVCATM